MKSLNEYHKEEDLNEQSNPLSKILAQNSTNDLEDWSLGDREANACNLEECESCQ